ncbi:DUF6884 domain-containing protein [Streptomyces sp. CA2R106]|uniref:DUF6884 domain-containing protein n=1 Tax=Streptomyces sp. CA2R106 TaxID=3120153 RepID=UPI00300AD606
MPRRDGEGAAWAAALRHDDEHARRRDELENGERRRQQAAALNWSQAQADAMLWADRDWLHFDGQVFYKKDMSDPRAGRGRTVARARVEALVNAGFLRVTGQSVQLTRDGHDARHAWIAAGEPAAQESRHLRPLMGGEEEARQDAERAAYLAAAREQQAERDALARRFTPEPAPAAAVDPAACDHERYVWLYLTADCITGRLGYHLACACGQETKAYPGNSPAMNTGTATRPLGIADADTGTAVFHADRCGYGVTGRWEVLDEHTKRAAVEPADEPLWPAVTDPNRGPAAAPVAAVDQDAAEQPAPADSVTHAPVTEAHEDEDQTAQRHRSAILNAELGLQPGEADALTWAAAGHLHRNGNSYHHRDPAKARNRSGRTVARGRVEALIRAGYLHHDNDHGPVTLTPAGDAAHHAYTALCAGASDDDLAGYRAQLAAHHDERETQTTAAAAAESVTDEPVTKTAGPAATDDAAEAYAAWIDRQAERSGQLAVDGPGIVGPGTQITYRDGRGPGMRSKHSTSGTVVRIGRTAVAWRPYGARRVLRTPLDHMRVTVPRTGAVVEDSGRTAGWRRWSLAEHLAYARRFTAPAPETVEAASAPQSAPQDPAWPDARPEDTEPVQLPLWPAPVASHAAAAAEPAVTADGSTAAVESRAVTTAAVTESLAAGPVVVIPCSGAKLDRPAPAGELYRGSLHTMCRRAADALTADGGTVVVLSARWGLVPLAQVIAPYELRMGDTGAVTAAELRAQATRLGIDRAEDVTVLAGAAYTTAARSVWSHAAAPLAGSRGIGEMRQRLAQLARTGRRQTA